MKSKLRFGILFENLLSSFQHDIFQKVFNMLNHLLYILYTYNVYNMHNICYIYTHISTNIYNGHKTYIYI